MTYTMWNVLLAALLATTASLWIGHIIHLHKMYQLERRIELLEAEIKK